MPKKTKEIFKLYDEAANHLSTESGKIDSSKLNQLLSSLYSPGQSFQYIFDYSVRQFTYVSKNIKDIFNICPDTYVVENFLDNLHPDDLTHLLHCEEIAKYFLFSYIKKEQLPNYKVSYQIRLKDATGVYKLFLHQAIALSWDDEYKMSSSLANHSDINHITKVNNNKMSFIDITGGKSYYGISSIEDLSNDNLNNSTISNRELEVLSLIAEGFLTNEIADFLNISTSTVSTHRKNILRKNQFKTFAQATSHFVREGLI